MQQFYKGRTNNHLTWVMVDATDFATPESALSAATTIKIYGKLRGATGVNFVSSGTGSLTNDIQHVGPSVLGTYTIALAKADLSDASAAWYDQYIIALSATGAARQLLVVDGGIDNSAISAYQSRLSDLASYLVAMSGMLSDAHSAAILAASHASDAHSAALLGASAASDAFSAIIIVQSRLSDFNSAFVSQLSDFRSDLASFLTTTGVNLNASAFSDVRSAIAAGPAATVTASDISDIASAVNAILGSRMSDILSAAVQTNSRALVIQSMLSDVQSVLSNVNSMAASAPTTSDIASAVVAEMGGDVSDIRSSILSLSGMLSDAHSAAAAAASRVLIVQSRLSDFNSAFVSQLSDFRSDLGSLLGTTGVQLNASVMSDLRSAITAGATGLDASALSDIASAVVAAIAAQGVSLDASTMSDIRSSVLSLSGMLSDAHSAATAAASRALINQSRISDVQSYLVAMSGMESDIYSLLSDAHSDLKSQLTAGVAINASGLSDVGSAVLAAAAANPIDANIQEINDTVLQGNGTAGTPWGPV